MSDNQQKNETVDDIVAFIRKCLDLLDTELTRMSNKEHALSADALLCPVLNAKAALDRIEAAWKRERSKVEADALAVGGIVEAARTAEKSSAVGNAAAMRKALESCLDFIMRLDRAFNPLMQNLLEDAIAKANTALSAPPRNCDVGTAEEQTHRMLLYCKYHGVDENRCFRCEGCPILTADICELSWAQLPYEAQEGGKK